MTSFVPRGAGGSYPDSRRRTYEFAVVERDRDACAASLQSARRPQGDKMGRPGPVNEPSTRADLIYGVRPAIIGARPSGRIDATGLQEDG